MPKKYPFQPDYAVAPGETLKESLEARGLSQADLALRTGMAEKTISQIIHGIAPISCETANKLELVLGIPASFWNNCERSYREALTRIEETQRLAKDVGWLRELPLADLIARNCIHEDGDRRSLVRQALRFFGVSSVAAWRSIWGEPAAQYRGKGVAQKKPGYVAAWLRMGELQSEGIETEPYDASLFKRVLKEVRTLTAAPASQWWQQLPALCGRAGVAVVYTKEIRGAGVSGATRWMTKDKALLQLSLKYKTDDQLWFTFFPEAGHILLHGKKQVFVEYGPSDATDEEQEASAFAQRFLIPLEYESRLPYLKTRVQVQEFAAAIGIAPGVVVGRLQHDGLLFPSAFNDLKRKLRWNS